MNYTSQKNIDNIVKGISNKLLLGVANKTVIGDTTPVGTIISFMGTQAPDFYLVCDGQTYNIEDYTELADFIEFQFGAKNYFGGNGTTTFAVPDLSGEFLRGSGTNSHTNQGSGSNVGVHQDGTTFPALESNFENNDLGLRTGTDVRINDVDLQYKAYSGTLVYQCVTTRKDNTLGQTYDTVTSRPTNTSVLYCIKYTKSSIPIEIQDGTPVGRIVFDYILRDGYIKANGAQVEDASINIPRLLAFVQQYSSQILAPDQATYEANVGLYMYDSTNDVLTLPNYIGRFVEGGNSITSIEAGLPNIKGLIGYVVPWLDHTPTSADTIGNGAFLNSSYNPNRPKFSYSDGGTGVGIYGFDASFDAHESNSIYSDSVTTVQPPAITLIPQIRY